jgi:hypothetical protein
MSALYTDRRNKSMDKEDPLLTKLNASILKSTLTGSKEGHTKVEKMVKVMLNTKKENRKIAQVILVYFLLIFRKINKNS